MKTLDIEREIMECELTYESAYGLLKRLQKHIGTQQTTTTPFDDDDAARWRHAVAHGFPSRAQSGAWVGHRKGGSIVVRDTADAVIDVVMQEALK